MKRIFSLVLVLALLMGCAVAETNGTGHWHDKWLPNYQYSGESKLPEYMNTESYFPIIKEGENVTLNLGLVYNDTYTDPEQVKDSWFYTFLAKETGLPVRMSRHPQDDVAIGLGAAAANDRLLSALIRSSAAEATGD